MTNFTLIGAFTFKVNLAQSYRRSYSVYLKKNGKIRIKNIYSGVVLFDNLGPDEVLIDSEPLKNIEELRRLVFNFSCDCEGDEPPIDDSGIFDDTFDDTFE